MDAEPHASVREGLLDRVFHGTRVGMVVARFEDGTILEANETFASLLGRPLTDVLAGNVYAIDLWGEPGPARTRRELDEAGLIDGYDTSLRDERGRTRIVRVWAEVVDGAERLVVVRASDVDGRVGAGERYHELRETEVRFRAIVEQMPAITYTQVEDPQGPTGFRDVYISPQTLPLLGYTPEEWQADPALWITATHPDDRQRVIDEDREAARTGDRFVSEYRMIAKDGTIRWFRDEAVFIEDPATGVALWQGVMLDVTEAREAQGHHAESEAKYRSLVEQLPAVVYLAAYGEDGDWLYISPRLEHVLGYTPEEWLAHPGPMTQLTHPDDLAAARAAEEHSFRTGEPYRAEYRMRRADGRYVWILDEASVVRDAEGTPLCMQGLLYDITARKEAEERLIALDGLKNTLLHTLSHDLKEPLTAILGAASTLERLDASLAPDERQHLLRTLVDRTKGMNSLLTDLLDLERLDRGIVEPRRFPVELCELIRKIVERTDVLRGREIEVDAGRCIATVDAPKVERMIENLLANAARHTPVGSRIWVRVEPGDLGVTIVVEDEGTGVDDALKTAIFEPFRRGADAGLQPGSGIGLSLVARFAELHGGRAWVQDREGGGASFRVYLPDAPAVGDA